MLLLSGDRDREETWAITVQFRVVLVHFISTALKSQLQNECIDELLYFLAKKKAGILVFLSFQFSSDVGIGICFYLLGAMRVI